MAMHTNALPGPEDITRHELPNGVVVLVRENHHAESVVITGSLNAGSVYDPPEAVGLASFTAAALLRGTATRDFATIHELLEGSGASLSISGGMHTVGFSGKSLAEDLPMLLDLLADALLRPSFPPAQIERLRGQIVTSLKIRQQDTRYVAGTLFRELAYPADHPYSRRVEGQVDSVATLTREQLMDYHQRQFGPQGMVIIVVGAVQSTEVLSLIEDCFGDWQNLTQANPPDLHTLPQLAATKSQTVAMPGKSQADIVLGVPGPSRYADDWQPANLANSILGLFGMYGRIGAEVREKHGMAYYSYSIIDGGLGPGAWRVIAGINPSNVERAVQAIRSELRRIITEPVTEEELADNKANFIGRLPLQLERNEGVAGAILSMERYGLGLDYLKRYADVVSGVTAEDVLAAAQHYLSADIYALAVAGPPQPNGREIE